MRIVRKITYESDDPQKLEQQIAASLKEGVHNLATKITVETLETAAGCNATSGGWFEPELEPEPRKS